MITFIILGIVAILAIGVIALVWNNGATKRMNQSEIGTQQESDGEPKIGRATGPD